MLPLALLAAHMTSATLLAQELPKAEVDARSPHEPLVVEFPAQHCSRNQRPCQVVGTCAAGALVWASETLAIVDVESATSKFIWLPPDTSSARGAAVHAGAPVVLTTGRQERLYVSRWNGERWTDLELPDLPPLRVRPGWNAFAADDEQIAVVRNGWIARFVDGEWSLREQPDFAPREEFWRKAGEPDVAIRAGSTLLVGNDEWEQGGLWLGLELTSGVWSVLGGVAEDHFGASSVARDGHGAVWCTSSLERQASIGGALLVLDRGDLREVARCTGPCPLASIDRAEQTVSMDLAHAVRRQPDTSHAWNLRVTRFDALAFDSHDRVVMLTRSLGLVRQGERGRWDELTPAWPGELWKQPDQRIPPRPPTLAISGDVAVCGLGYWGLLLADLRTGVARSVDLELPRRKR